MGKYDPLRKHLEDTESPVFEASFEQVERILGFPLPQSAYRHQAWWANESHGSHSHARSWQDAGWETSRVNTAGRTVRFKRRRNPRAKDATSPPPESSGPSLWEQAAEITGIKNRDALIEAALRALIQREAGRQLAEMGGTMPDFRPAPRERPFE